MEGGIQVYRYVLNLNSQSNGDYEVHKDGCYYFPVNNFEELGKHYGCESAVEQAKARHPFKSINGCKHCAPTCHTS